jgi:hypothetical protein
MTNRKGRTTMADGIKILGKVVEIKYEAKT